jgi:hypothetical protein
LAKSDLTVIANSYNAGFVAALSNEAGGFVGDLRSKEPIYIQNSFNVGQVHSQSSAVGGFIGELGGTSSETTTSTTFISNSYNAGYISTEQFNDTEKGGLIGQVNNDRHVRIANSFNVGTFSVSVTEQNPPRYLPRNGAIIGDPEGNVSLENVAFYVDETRQQHYLNHPMQSMHPLLANRITDRTKFEASGFMYQSLWNMDSVWKFAEAGYPFPILRDLPFVDAKEHVAFDPTITDDVFFDNVRLRYDDVIQEHIISIDSVEVFARDTETPTANLDIKLYALLGSVANLQTVLSTGDLFVADLRVNTSRFEDLTTLPTQGDGEYFFYTVVTDNEGNQDMQVSNFSLQYKEVANNLAPIPSNNGLLNVVVFNYDPDMIEINFTSAIDDLTANENLQYHFIITTTDYDFSLFNPITLESPEGLLFSRTTQPDLILEYDISSLNLSAGSYKATVFVNDGVAFSQYVVVNVVLTQ